MPASSTMPGPRRYTLRKTHTTLVVTFPEPPVPDGRSADAAEFSRARHERRQAAAPLRHPAAVGRRTRSGLLRANGAS